MSGSVSSPIVIVTVLTLAGLLISNIDIDIDTIDDTFEVSISISTILLCPSIDSGIDDTFSAVFIDTSISILLG